MCMGGGGARCGEIPGQLFTCSDVVRIPYLEHSSGSRLDLWRAQGAFKDTTPDVLLAEVLAAVLARTGVNPSDIGEVPFAYVECVLTGVSITRFPPPPPPPPLFLLACFVPNNSTINSNVNTCKWFGTPLLGNKV